MYRMLIGTGQRMALRAASLLFTVCSAVACPLCHTVAGDQLRAGLFGPDFVNRLLLLMAPFPLFALVVALVYYHFPVEKET